jgi:4-amino-4-deoxy-L-arabinose transferase-like glycosyltransferase
MAVISSTTTKPIIRSITRKKSWTLSPPAAWPLFLILATQAIVSLATLHNTAFQDEGLYIYAGQQIVRYWMGGPAPLENYAFYFSGYPWVYPVIGGVLDKIGGLELARAFSLFCMMGVNVIVYFCTKKFFQRSAAIFASAAYASLGTVLYIGRLATFDAMCLFLIALGAALAIKVSTSRHAWLALLIGPVLVLSILAKYAAMLFSLPVLGILVFASLAYLGWWRMILRLVLALISLAGSLATAYHFMDKSAFHAISGTTTNRVAEITKSRLELFLHVLQMGGLVWAAALVGLVLVFRIDKRFRLIALLLFGSSWLVPAYHIYEQEAVSIDKHMAFSLFFAAPLAGYALAWISGYRPRSFSFARVKGRHWLAGLSVILLIFMLGTQQSQTIYAQWANTGGLSRGLHTQIRDGSGRLLVEDIEVARYDAKDITEPWQWNGVNYFYYAPPGAQPLLGDPALTQAIKDRYFAIIELSFNYYPYEATFIAKQMIATRNYDLIATIPFQNSFGTGHFYLWRSAAVPGHGNFTNLSQVVI